jgi:hypothetical protein
MPQSTQKHELARQPAGETETAIPPHDTGFIDQKELLRRLPVARRTLHNWRRAGKIPSIVIGRRVLFCWENVSAALRRLEHGNAQ